MKPEHSKTKLIEDQITNLYDELLLAKRWNRPSILLSAYRSKLVFLDVQYNLEQKLARKKIRVEHVAVNSENFDIPLTLSQHPDKDQLIFFVSGIKDGGGEQGLNAYRALNMRRELFVDHRIKIIVWMDESEASKLPLHALDFWAFRHRMIELFEEPDPERAAWFIRSLNWLNWNREYLLQDFPPGYTLRSQLLEAIPGWDHSSTLRAELMHMLAAYHWSRSEFNKAKDLLEQSLELVRGSVEHALEARIWSGMGIVLDELGQAKSAQAALENATRLDTNSAEAWLNMGKYHFKQGQFTAAEPALKKSLELAPGLAEGWNFLGEIYRSNGQYNEAITAYLYSVSSNPKDARIWLEIGKLYLTQNRSTDAIRPLQKAKQILNSNPEAWINLGLVYQNLGLTRRAIRALYKATRLNPASAVPWKYLADIYQQNKRPKYAQKALQTAQSLEFTQR